MHWFRAATCGSYACRALGRTAHGEAGAATRRTLFLGTVGARAASSAARASSAAGTIRVFRDEMSSGPLCKAGSQVWTRELLGVFTPRCGVRQRRSSEADRRALGVRRNCWKLRRGRAARGLVSARNGGSRARARARLWRIFTEVWLWCSAPCWSTALVERVRLCTACGHAVEAAVVGRCRKAVANLGVVCGACESKRVGADAAACVRRAACCVGGANLSECCRVC